jgi:hypothetical protein
LRKGWETTITLRGQDQLSELLRPLSYDLATVPVAGVGHYRIIRAYGSERGLCVDFEEGFDVAERAAIVAAKSVATLVSALKQLRKAAADGDLGAMRKAADRVPVVAKSVSQEVENAVAAWPFEPDSEERYLQESYVAELLQRAQSENIQVQQLDDGYLVYPSIVRVVPSERVVTINRKKVRALRPSRLLDKLKAMQSAKPKRSSEQFLELLYRTYQLVAKEPHGITLALAIVYEALTLMPGSSAAYGKAEFARDLFLLDRSGSTKTKSGATVSFPASTGTKGGRNIFSFVSPDGESITYYGIHFAEASE